MLASRLGFWCAGDYGELAAGGCIALPRGHPHRFGNVGRTNARAMVVVAPGGFEQFFPAIGRRKPSGPAEMAAIAAEFGLRFEVDEGIDWQG